MSRKKKNRNTDLDEYCRYARENNTTYAQMQIQETLAVIEKIGRIPDGYRKVEYWNMEKRRKKRDERKRDESVYKR